MALIKCPECGKSISDQAISCPECGHPINQKPLKKIISKKTLWIGCAIAFVCIIVGSIIFINISNKIKLEEYYNQALDLYQNDKLTEAKEVLENIPDYEGVDELIVKITEREEELKEERYREKYYSAMDLFQSGDFTGAKEILNSLPKDLVVKNKTIDKESILEEIGTYKQVVTKIKKFSKSLKNPDSLEVKEVYYSAISEKIDKDVIYITYKATNSFGGYVSETACIQDGVYMGEKYDDIGFGDGLLAVAERQELNATIVQNGLKKN